MNRETPGRLIDLVVNLQVFTPVFNSEDEPVTLASPHAASFRGKLPARCPESTRLMFVEDFRRLRSSRLYGLGEVNPSIGVVKDCLLDDHRSVLLYLHALVLRLW